MPNSLRPDPSLWLLAALFATVGVLHFTNPAVFLQVMPPWLPMPLPLVFLSGFFEIAGALGILFPAIRKVSGWGLIALLVAVFPANIHMAVNSQNFPSIPVPVLWLRLPLQGLLVYWVYRACRLSRAKALE